MLSSHLYLGLPCDLLVRGFQLNIFLTVLVSGILIYEYMITKYGNVPNTTQNYVNTYEIFVLLGRYAAQTDSYRRFGITDRSHLGLLDP